MKRRKSSTSGEGSEESSHDHDDDDDEYESHENHSLLSSSRRSCLVRCREQDWSGTKAVLGVESPLPDIPMERLSELWKCVDSLEDKAAYDLALSMDAAYTTDAGRGVAFLRSVDGKARQAAKRYVKHFATKLDLFGRDLLCQDITLQDLSQHDMEALRSGGFQVLKDNDRAGRPILMGRYTAMKYRDPRNMVSRGWLVLSLLSRGSWLWYHTLSSYLHTWPCTLAG